MDSHDGFLTVVIDQTILSQLAEHIMPLAAAPLFRKMLTVAFVLAPPLRTVHVGAVAASAAASTTQCEMEIPSVCPLVSSALLPRRCRQFGTV